MGWQVIMCWQLSSKAAASTPSRFHRAVYSAARLSVEAMPFRTGPPSFPHRYRPLPWPQSETARIFDGAIPARATACRMTEQLASHISSMSRSTKPGLRYIERVSSDAEEIWRPLLSNTAAFVVVPPLSMPK